VVQVQRAAPLARLVALAPLPSERGYLGVRIDLEEGMSVVEVMPGGGAAEAGLAAGDRILSIDGQSTGAEDDVQAVLSSLEAGKSAAVVYERDGKKHKAKVALRTLAAIQAAGGEDEDAEEAEDAEAVEVVEEADEAEPPVTEIEWLDAGEVDEPAPPARAGLPDDERGYIGISLESMEGPMKVLSVRPGSGAAEVGIAAGDVILAIDGQAGETEDLLELLQGKKAGERVQVRYQRDGEQRRARVELRSHEAMQPEGSDVSVEPEVVWETTESQPAQPLLRRKAAEGQEREIQVEREPGDVRVFRARTHTEDADEGEAENLRGRWITTLGEDLDVESLEELGLSEDIDLKVHEALRAHGIELPQVEVHGRHILHTGDGKTIVIQAGDDDDAADEGQDVRRRVLRLSKPQGGGGIRWLAAGDDDDSGDADDDADDDSSDADDKRVVRREIRIEGGLPHGRIRWIGVGDADDDDGQADDDGEDDDGDRDVRRNVRILRGDAPHRILWRGAEGDADEEGEQEVEEIVIAPRIQGALQGRLGRRGQALLQVGRDDGGEGARPAGPDRRIEELERRIQELERHIQELERALGQRRAR